jgi:hypothetical protein
MKEEKIQERSEEDLHEPEQDDWWEKDGPLKKEPKTVKSDPAGSGFYRVHVELYDEDPH